MESLDQSLQSAQTVLSQFTDFLPNLFGALLLLIIGWLVAKVVRAGVSRLLRLLRFQQLAERAGIEDFLRQSYITTTTTAIVAALAYWFVLLITVVMVVNSLGLTVVAELFNRAALYVPHVIAAVLVLVFGVLLARLLGRSLFAMLKNMEFEGAGTVATLAEYAIIVFVVFMALEQLQISTVLLHSAFQISFGAICLALALAFGLGGKDWAADVIRRATEKKKKSYSDDQV